MQTLYLKYRPQTLQELDLVNVREKLEKIVANKNIPHAFLFAGPKGTGKTSAARILAKVVNCENSKKNGVPCNKCSQCLSITKGDNIDILELDAASNRGIDDIRLLRESIKLSPASANKKVYIIDEAHMLTKDASNALLKTLEEPPEHVIFVLATTNPEKIIGTIRSRTTEVSFSKATSSEIVKSLEKVVKGEGLKAENEALLEISKHAKGSFRDANKILENLIATDIKLNFKKVKEALSNSHIFDQNDFFEKLFEKDAKACLEIIENAYEKGIQIETVVEDILSELKNELLSKSGIGEERWNVESDELVLLMDLFVEVLNRLKFTSLEHIPFEIAVVKWIGFTSSVGPNESTSKIEKKEKVVTSKKEKSAPAKNQESLSGKVNKINNLHSIDDNIWTKIISGVGMVNRSVGALLRASRPLEFNGDKLHLGVFYKFHKEKLEDLNYKKIVEDVLNEIFGAKVTIYCTLTEAPQPSKSTSNKDSFTPSTVLRETEESDIVNVASEIFN